jgi:flavin-dependent dehydrogenase
MKNYKVVIVGSGPAGVSAAMHLNLMKPELTDEILVLEKTEHPREKICAGGVTGRAQMELYQLGINFHRLDIPKVSTDVFRFRLGSQWKDTFETGFNAVIRRNEFDAALVDIAKKRGITVREGEEVKDFERQDNGVKVITDKDEYLAEVVIGADGVGSRVRQKLIAPNDEYEFSRLHLIETPVDEEETGEFTVGAISFDMTYVTEGLQGYVWDFPCYMDGKPHLTRGIVDHNPDPTTRVDILEIYRKALKKRGVNLDDYKLKTWPELIFDPTAQFASDRVLLAGDSAGIDALMGEGISQAFGYGKLVASLIVKAIDSGDYSFSDYNEKLMDTFFAKELMVTQKLADYIYREQPVFWISLLWQDPDMTRMITSGYGAHMPMHKVPEELLMQKVKAHQERGDFSLPDGVEMPKK